MLWLSAALFLHATPQFETFSAPGYETPVSGVRYRSGEAASALPLGALGTGYIDLTSDGKLGAATVENTWLKPMPVAPESGLQFQAGGRNVSFLPADGPAPEDLRFWGHYPAADLDLGTALDPVKVTVRAFAPFIPHDYDLSNLPVAFFHVTAVNTGAEAIPVSAALQWAVSASGNVETATAPECATAAWEHGMRLTLPHGSYALGALGGGWDIHKSVPGERMVRVEARLTLDPGKTARVALAIAWRFPEWTSSDGERLRHRYAIAHKDAAEVLARALPRADDIERKIIAWQSKIYRSDAPPTLQDAVINSLYVLARNSWWLDDGRFFQSESFTGCPITETLVCRFNGAFPLALLFPECERATMREFIKWQADSGQIAFGFGTPLGTKTPMFDLQKPIVTSQFVLMLWRNHVLWHDDAYLKESYPALKSALRFAMTLDTDGDGLINEAPGSDKGFPANQYYDIWPWWGTSAYTAGIWLAALQAGIQAAEKQDDQAFAKELEGWFSRGRDAYESKLWTGAYYRLYSDPANDRKSDTSLTNALCGQWFAYTCGLGELVPRAHIQSVIDTVLRLNAAATPYGAVNGVRPDGTPDDSFADHSGVITIGEVWNFCAMAAFAGRTNDALALFQTSYENVALRQRSPWNIPWSLDRATGALKWGINYYSNPCVWTLLQAVAPAAYRDLIK